MNRSRKTADLASHGNIFVDIANDRVGIGSTIPGTKLQLPDSEVLSLGNAGDLQLVHTPSLTSISSSGVNNFTIRQSAGSGFLFIHGDQLHLRSQSTNEPYLIATNNGPVSLYYDNSKKLETTSVGVAVTGKITTTGNIESNADASEFRCGANGDFRISHSGSENILRSDFPFFFRNMANNETLANFNVNGSVELYYDNAKKFETTTNGINVYNSGIVFQTTASGTNTFGNIQIPNDNGKIKLGASQDLEIFHSGSHSFILNNTGNLVLSNMDPDENNEIHLRARQNEQSIVCKNDGAVELYHDNSKKFETTSSGATVTGTLTATSFSGGGANLTAVNADTLDGAQGSQFLRSDSTDTCTGQITFTNQIISRKNGDRSTQGGNALILTHSTTPALRANHFIHDDFPSGSGTYYIQVTESGVTNDRNMCLQGYGGKLGVGMVSEPTATLHVTGTFRTTSTSTFDGDATFNGGAGAVTIPANSDMRFINGTWSGDVSGNVAKIQHHNNILYISGGSSGIYFRENNANRWFISDAGHFISGADSTYDIGSSGNRVRNGYFDTLYGDGSNLTAVNATTLDSIDSGSFLRSDATDTASGNLTFNGVVAATNQGSIPDKIGNYKICRTNNSLSSIDNLDSFLFSKVDGSYPGGTKPSNSHNGVGVISMQTHTGSYYTQLALSTQTNDLFIRSANNSSSYGSWKKIWSEENDGSGSGLDADTVDGIEASSFLRSDATDTCSGQITHTNKVIIDHNSSTMLELRPQNSSPWVIGINRDDLSQSRVFAHNPNSQSVGWVFEHCPYFYNSGSYNKLLSTADEGSGNGLDADTLDGVQGASFLRSDQDDSSTGTITFSDSEGIRLSHSNQTDTNDGRIAAGTHGSGLNIVGTRTLSSGNRQVRIWGDVITDAGNKFWNAGNDGSGSGLDADTVDGLHLGGTGNSGANQIVRTQGNGYIFSSFINTTSGDTGTGSDCTRFYASQDAYIRYIDLRSMRSVMNVSARSSAFSGREDHTSDQNYWIGSAGWGTSNFDTTVWDFGSCFFDTWGNPSGQPSGTSHWTGVQAMHYTNGSSRYGMRITCGAGQPQLAYIQGRWNQTTNGWFKLWNAGNDGSGSGLDADTLDGQQGSYYKDVPSGTVMVFRQNSAPTGWTKSTSHNNKAMRIVSGNVSSGGSNAFSTAFNSSRGTSGGSVSNHTLTTAQMPSHTHTGVAATHDSNSAGSQGYPAGNQHNRHRSTDRPQNNNMAAAAHQNTGSTNSHNHGFSNPSINLNVQYLDFIICTRS